MKSRSYSQLQGNVISLSTAQTDCDPIVTNDNIASPLYSYDGKTKLDGNAVAFPCGLVAKSFFNDTYNISTPA